mmetsp:Transcript_13742/g.19695  ORF Transcript_13742/g.19695 Transcript_13742/m.19695 type:complete len:420 (+) Transcript_13742:62-1321(+)
MTDSKEEWEVQCEESKRQGDASFRTKDYAAAIQHYSAAIELDPENVVLYSNRSAAYLANSDKSNALYDAQKCVQLNADFVKGYTRYAAALSSLGRYKDALTQYKHALVLEPENSAALQGLQTVTELEKKRQQALIERERELAQVALSKQQQRPQENEVKEENKEIKKQSAKKENDKDDQVDEEDDLLDEFFDEVEQVSAAKPPAATKKEPSSKLKTTLSNLGTSQQQMDRLLQTNYQWRNLNPYYVLGISDPTNADLETIQKRYKALSLLVHPDKCLGGMQQRARDAFEEVNKAIKLLQDEDKRKHVLGLIEAGKKNAKREWDSSMQQQNNTSTATYEQIEEKAIMKIFAQVEMKRRDVERRKREYEKRERTQEDEELKKQKGEREFDSNWRKTERVEQRVGNWREFHETGAVKKKTKR